MMLPLGPNFLFNPQTIYFCSLKWPLGWSKSESLTPFPSVKHSIIDEKDILFCGTPKEYQIINSQE